MKHTREERLDIGRQIYDGEIDKYQAAEKYGISIYSARDYMREYRAANQLPPKRGGWPSGGRPPAGGIQPEPQDLEAYESMSKEELIRELVKARIAEARLKKGYEVKGDGSVILYNNENTR